MAVERGGVATPPRTLFQEEKGRCTGGALLPVGDPGSLSRVQRWEGECLAEEQREEGWWEALL